METLLVYWPAVIGVAAVAVAGWSGFSLLNSISEIRDSSAGRIRSRVRDLSADDETARRGPITWLEQLAAASMAGWPNKAAMALDPLISVLDKGGLALDEQRLGQAGLSGQMTAEDMRRVRGVAGLVAAVFLGLMGLAGGVGQAILFAGLGLMLGARVPSFYLAGIAASRQRQCIAALPEMADMLALGTRAGMSFDRALDLYIERFDGPLSDEFAGARTQWKFGALTRDEALDQIADRLRTDAVTRMIGAVQQALRLGSPLARVLEDQSKDARTAHKAAVEKQIGEAPVKMLAPMGALILPAMLILLMGPIVLNVMRGS